MTLRVSTFNCKRCKDRNLLKQCECGCGTLIPHLDKQSRVKRFAGKHATSYLPRSPPKKEFFSCKICRDRNLLKQCECSHCETVITDREKWRGNKKRFAHGHQIRIPLDRQCVECGTAYIKPHSYAKKSARRNIDRWVRVEEGFQCHKCYEYAYARKPEVLKRDRDYRTERRKIPELNEKIKAIGRKYRWKPNVKEHVKIRKRARRRDRQRADEIEKTQSAFAAFAKTAEDPSLIESIKLQIKQEEEQRRARKNATRRRWRAKRKALGLPYI